MVQLRTGFEAATGTYSTNSATVPAASGESAFVTLIGGGNLTVATTNVFKGTKSLQINPIAGQNCAVRVALPAPSFNVAFDEVFRTPSTTTDETYVITVRGGTANVMNITYLPTGFIRVRTSGASNHWTSTVAIPTNTHVRIKGVVDIDTAVAANSTFKVGLFNPTTDASLGSGAVTPDWVVFTPGATDIQSVQFGKTSLNADTTVFTIDEARVETEGFDFIPAETTGLVVNVSSTPVSGQVPFTVPTTATLQNAVGTKTYTFNWGDGTVTAAQSSNVASHQYTTPGTYAPVVSVPDN